MQWLSKDRRKWLFLLTAWLALIFVTSGSFISIKQLSQSVSATTGLVKPSDFERIWLVVWWLFVKGWHAVEFGLLYWFASKVKPEKPIWPLLAVAVLALLDEYHQSFVPWRGGRLSDVFIDLIGVATAYLILRKSVDGDQSKNWLKSRGFWVLLFTIDVAAIFLLSVFPFGAFR